LKTLVGLVLLSWNITISYPSSVQKVATLKSIGFCCLFHL
jgi:hypothetical protein